MALSDAKNALWVEKWRPKSISDCVLPKRILEPIKSYIGEDKNKLPHLLFYGRPGNSKTTLAKCIVRDIGAESIYVDASSENGKNMLANTVVPFASTVSVVSKEAPKVVILDECDGLTPQAFSSARPIMEMYSKQTRFILTCNYINKVPEPIQSRCTCFDFNLSQEEKPEVLANFFKRANSILKEENIKIENKQALGMLIAELAPDWRRVINTLQTYSNTHGKIDEGILTFSSGSDIAKELYPLILGKKFDESRKRILESTWSPDDIYSSLFKFLPDYVKDKGKQAQMVLVISKYQYQSAFSANQDINTLACIVEMMLSV